MKKLISLFLVACMCLVPGLILTGCGTDQTHEHTFKKDWTFDNTHHWHACEGADCKEISDKAEHVWDQGVITAEPTADANGTRTFTCTVCGQTKTEAVPFSSNTTTPPTGTEPPAEPDLPDDPLPPAALTEAEMLRYVMDAISATEAYHDSMTLNISVLQSQTSLEDGTEETESATSNALVSFDSVNKLCYSEETEVNPLYGTYTYYEKTFLQNGILYGMDKEISVSEDPDVDPRSEEQYFKIHESALEEYQSFEMSQFLDSLFGLYSEMETGTDLTEIRSAFEATLPILLADLFDGVTPTVTVNVSVSEENEAYVLLIEIDSSCENQEDEETYQMSLDFSCKLVAKDQKIVEFAITNKMHQNVLQDETVIGGTGYEIAQSATLDYVFAQDKYDALTVNLPEDPDEILVEGAPIDSYSDLKLQVFVNGVDMDMYVSGYWDEIETAEDMFDTIMASIIYSEDANIRLYSDEACTRELTRDTVTDADFFAMEKVYAKVTPKSGSALVQVYGSTRKEYSKPFRIALPFMDIIGAYYGEAYMETSLACYSPDEDYTLKEEFVSDPNHEIWINGVKQVEKPETIDLEDGMTYIIQYVAVITDPVAAE